jgi:predicted CopG family antitoxin
MARRVTIMIDDDIFEKLRKHQADKISKENRNVTFSEVINEFAKKSKK